MSKFIVRITKSIEVEVDAETRQEAEQIARDQMADGCFTFDTEIVVRSVGMGGRTFCQWLRVLDNEHGVSVYETEDHPGQFRFTGCESDFETTEEAIEAAVLHYGLIEAD